MKGFALAAAALAALSTAAAPTTPTTQTRTPTTQRTSTAAPAAEFPSLREPITALESPLERELAARIIKRQQIRPGTAEMVVLDLGIDVRIVHRWFLAQILAAKSDSESQVIALLRSTEMADAIRLLEQDQKPGWVPTQSQLTAMGRLHKLTFDLGEPKDAAAIDDVARKVGTELTTISNPTPIDPHGLPLMRPSRLKLDEEGKPATKEAVRSVSELESEATRLAISIPLRQQLLAMAKAAAAGDEKESAALRRALADGVDLAKGLSHSTAFTSDAKEQIETQLAEGLALSSDPRTRGAGVQRIDALNEYRLVMNRIAHSTLPADVRSALAPAFAYAQTHAAEGTRLLNQIEDFTKAVGKLDALPKRENPVAALRPATNDVAKQLGAARQAFVTAANDLSNPSGGGLAGLDTQLADLRDPTDLYATLMTMQQTYEVLNAYKPRPYGMIEQRAQRAASAAASTARTTLHAEGVKFLMDLNRLARLSEAVTTRSLADVPPEVLDKYAGVSTSEFSAKVKLLMADLVNSAAAGQEPDRKKIDRLNAVDQLVEALHTAAEFEQNLDALPSLQKWADWTITTEQLRALVAPYQQLVSGAFSGFVSDTPDALEKFLRQRKEYAPVMTFVSRDAHYADACAALPEGLQATLARLMTPMHDQAFETERYVSFAVSAWAMLNDGDPDGAQAAVDAAAKRLQREQRRPAAPPPATKPAAPARR